ncbi:MAG: DUF4365 domain-containing protein [Ignavibacteria bacterium]
MKKLVVIPENKIKEQISNGCLTAIISKAGLLIDKPNEDYGVDFRVTKIANVKGKLTPGATVFDIQLKSTTNWEIDGGNIIYSLRNKNYNDIVLRNKEDSTRMILVIMCLNKNKSLWCKSYKSVLIFRNSLFWTQIKSKTYKTNTESSTKIKIPIENVLTEENVLKLYKDLDYV